MKARIAALALLAAAALGQPAQAAANPLIEVVDTLCIPNHADPTKVIAAADAGGWGPLGPQAMAQVEGRFDAFTPTMREKTSAGRRLILVVGDSPVPDGARTSTRHRCWIESDLPNSPSMLEDLKAYFGRGPTVAVSTVSGWAYVQDREQRTFVAADGAIPAGATLTLVMTSSGFSLENIGYNETAP
jgi:hypothetical protein